jgi:hypothetical protein
MGTRGLHSLASLEPSSRSPGERRGSAVYGLGGDGRIVGLNAATGEVVFEDRMPGPAGGTVTMHKNRIFVGYGFNFVTTPVSPPFAAGVRSYGLRGN